MTDDVSALRALFINCALKRSPEVSNTQALVDVSAGIMKKHGIGVEVVRAIDHDIATEVSPDMREHGAASDAGRSSSRRCWPPTSWSWQARSGWATTVQ